MTAPRRKRFGRRHPVKIGHPRPPAGVEMEPDEPRAGPSGVDTYPKPDHATWPASYAPEEAPAHMARICILNGVHTPGSDWEKECPVLRARRRQEAANDVTNMEVAGSADAPSSATAISQPSRTVFRDGRAFRPGRPRVEEAVQRRKAAERARAYRVRKKAADVATNDALLAGAR